MFEERIEREAIRECLMPRTKLCNYLYVRLRPSRLARAHMYIHMCVRRCDAVSLWRCVVHLHTHDPIRECVCARKSPRNRAYANCECENTDASDGPRMRIHTMDSYLSPKAHGAAYIMSSYHAFAYYHSQRD